MPRVLIAEDAAVDRALTLSLLEGIDDLEVSSVTNGREAIEAIAADPPDIVVTDLIMPEMGGLELVEAVKERYPLIPVIIMTSRGSEETAVRALALGAASYVPKRLLANNLVSTIESVFSASIKQRKRASLMSVMTRNRASFVLENDRALFRPLVQYLQDTMFEFDLFDETDRTRVCVAVEEALNNAAEHGNLELDSKQRDVDFKGYLQLMQDRCREPKYRDRRVRFEAEFTPAGAIFDVSDEGSGFDPDSIPDPTAEPTLDATSGRGLTLMRMFMDEVEFKDGGRRIRMVKRRKPAAGDA